jgi:histone-arginine methyltransferase CARM1
LQREISKIYNYNYNICRFLKPGGILFPTSSTLFFIPFCDETLYKEQLNKISFWDNENFFGLNMSCLKEEAKNEKFRQPVIDVYDPSIQ